MEIDTIHGVSVYHDDAGFGNNTYLQWDNGIVYTIPANHTIMVSSLDNVLTFMHSSALTAPQPASAYIFSCEFPGGIVVSAEGSPYTPMIFREEDGWHIRILDTENRAKTVAIATMSPDGVWSVEWMDEPKQEPDEPEPVCC